MEALTLVTLVCRVDDFCKVFEAERNLKLISHDTQSKRWWTTREPGLCMSEFITLAIVFHQCNYRTFKHFYLHYACEQLPSYFPGLVSYKPIHKLMKRILIPFFVFQHSLQGDPTGISFIDSTVSEILLVNRRFALYK